MYKIVFSEPSLPAIDLAFVIGASGSNADRVFILMKGTVNSIISTYGTSRIRYSLITFSATTIKQIDFLDNTNSVDALKALVQNMARRPGDLMLDKALSEAKKLFSSEGARANARKIVVVIVDKKSSAVEGDTRAAARSLEDARIRVVPVALGPEVDASEIRLLTPNRGNIVFSRLNEDATNIARNIMVKVLKGV